MKIHIGTSGWNYDCFVGKLYPQGTPKRKYLEAYAKQLETVELNASFYRGFPEKVWQGWYSRTPEGFLWSVKASRFLTHIRRLSVSQDEVNRFWQSVTPLKEKLAVALFQLPPNLPYDKGLLLSFLSMQPQGAKIAFEARHPTWHRDEIWRILEEYNVAWVVSHSAGHYPHVRINNSQSGLCKTPWNPRTLRGELWNERTQIMDKSYQGMEYRDLCLF